LDAVVDHGTINRLFEIDAAAAMCLQYVFSGVRASAKYAAAKDETVKAELDRLTAELAKLPERWEFYVWSAL
jgi:hypothetical protein